MKARHGYIAFCFLLATAAISIADDSRRVGHLGEPSRLVIEGAKTFSSEEIRAALFDEFDVVDASDEDDPYDALIGIIAAKTVAGYQCAGFPDVKATVVDSGGQLMLSIEEGERYTKGEVLVSGNKGIDANQIRDELTAPESDAKPRPIWEGEGPASFNAEYQEWLTTKVSELAGDQGFYRSSLKVAVAPDAELKKGTLEIEFIDEGPRTTLSDVAMEGNSANSRDTLLAYVNIDPHTPLTRAVRQQVEKQLLHSGRFLRVHWQLGEAASRDDAWQPRLSLEEYELAPPLGATITREEAALLRLAEWVERFEESDEEVLIRFPSENVSVVFAPRHGFIIEAEPRPDAQAAERKDGFLGAIVMAEERVGLYSAAQRRKIDAAPPPAPIVGNADITLVDGGPGLSGRGLMAVGIGMRASTSKALRRHVQMKLKLSAAAALSVVRTHEANTSWDGEVVCFEWKHRRMRVNALTGQFIEQVVETALDDNGNAADDDSWAPHIKLASGEFQRRLAEIEKLTADWPNSADDRRPLSCVGEFLCQELQRFDSESKSGYAAIGKLIEQGLLQPCDQLVGRMAHLESEAFRIPQRYFHWRFNSFEELFALAPVLARAYGIGLGNRLFPQDSWTQTAWRNGVFLLADGRIEASDDLSCQPTDDQGAICALVSGEMLRAAGHEQLAAVCSRRGLRRLSSAAFRDDCRGLLCGQGFVTKCFLQMAAPLRTLNADDVKALAGLLTRLDVLDEEQAGIFERCLLALRNDDRATPAEAAGRALDTVWHAWLSDWVKQRLQALTAPPTHPEAPAFGYTREIYQAPAAGPGRYMPPWQTEESRPHSGGYGAAPIGAIPDYFPTKEPDKPLNQEVRELKWLAMALTDRLKELEERLAADGEQTAEKAAAISDASGAAASAEENNDFRFVLGGADGLTLVPTDTYLPTRVFVTPGQPCFFSLVGMNGRDHEPIHVHIRAAVGLPRETLSVTQDDIPLMFRERDVSAVLAGRTVTQVFYIIRGDGEPKVETRTGTGDGAKLVAEASTRGVVLATVSISNREGVEPPEISSAATADQKAIVPALEGYCPVLTSEETFQTFDASPERYLESPQPSVEETASSEKRGVGVQKLAAPGNRGPTNAEKHDATRRR